MTDSKQPWEREKGGLLKRAGVEVGYIYRKIWAASQQRPGGPATTLTGIVLSSGWNQAVFLSCLVDVLALQGHSINFPSLKWDRKG